ncbi:MFS general substrate transporter [Microthyrium microscopicum]|uniref:MFS general substrate transporter n=1 Tax=Microthyrium microscopicum TaxID=703497 RepID=A0A6A6U4S3_9PEZI|nr:MFS general substrate transporter [Microthyrium microscopicum]
MTSQITSDSHEAPGTILLYDKRNGTDQVILVPQPSSNDSNDPLRWSKRKKWTVLLIGAFYAFMGSVTGPIMAAGMIPLTKSLNTSLQRITYANGATLICQGVATTLWMPFAIKYGRRPVYLLSNLLMGIACFWCGLGDTNYGVLVSGRAFLGIFEAPIESIVPSTITDIFFLHERGEKVSVYGMAVLGGNELGPMFSAFIIQNLNMRWAFFIVGIIILAAEIPMFFFMPETKYGGVRPEVPGVAGRDGKVVEIELSDVSKNREKMVIPVVKEGEKESIPYEFDSQAQGLIFLSPFIGSIIGTYLCGPLSDAIANFYTKRNRGIREPEMRLPACAIAALFTAVGAIIVAVTLNNRSHWSGPAIGLGVLSIGAQMGATLAMAYSLDSHKELSAELMVAVASMKSAIAWIWTWVINDFIAARGPLTVFLTIMAINIAVYATTLLLYVKGKAARIWIHEKNLLGFMGLN